jgi:hypothetical protein
VLSQSGTALLGGGGSKAVGASAWDPVILALDLPLLLPFGAALDLDAVFDFAVVLGADLDFAAPAVVLLVALLAVLFVGAAVQAWLPLVDGFWPLLHTAAPAPNEARDRAQAATKTRTRKCIFFKESLLTPISVFNLAPRNKHPILRV